MNINAKYKKHIFICVNERPEHSPKGSFARCGAVKEGLSIPVLLFMGGLAGVIGVENVLLISPLLLFALGIGTSMCLRRWRKSGESNAVIVDRVSASR